MLAGHNRGKTWVPGVGYRTPDRPPPPPPKCERCGEPATAWTTWHGWRCEKHRTKHPGYRANDKLSGGEAVRSDDLLGGPLICNKEFVYENFCSLPKGHEGPCDNPPNVAAETSAARMEQT